MVFVQAFEIGYQVPVYDAVGYGSRGLNFSVIPSVEAKDSGLIVAPLYPAFLNLMMGIDSELKQSISCYVAHLENCDVSGLASVYFIQTCLIALTVYFAFLACFFFSNRFWYSLTVMVLVIAVGHLEVYSTWLITEAWAFFGFMGFIACLAYALRGKASNTVFVLMGVALSVATLTRPSYLYLAYSLVFVIPFYWWVIAKGKPIDALMKTGAFLLPFICLVLPWMLRNYFFLDSFNISLGYGSYILSERVAYNMMSWSEWAVSFIYWLPIGGGPISRELFDSDLYSKLDFSAADGYYLYGNTVLRSAIYEAAQTDKERLNLLVSDYILADLVKHIAVTISLALRGMWLYKGFGMIGAVFLIPGIFLFKKITGIAPLLAFAYPFFFMVGFNAFVSVSVWRYNIPLVLIFSMAIVVSVMAFGEVLRKQQCLWNK